MTERGVVELHACGHDDRAHREGLFGWLSGKIDGLSRTHIDAAPAVGAVLAPLNRIGIGHGAEGGLVCRPPQTQPSLEWIGDLLGADPGAAITVDAAANIDVAWAALDRGHEIAGLSLKADESALRPHVEILGSGIVEEIGRDGWSRTARAMPSGTTAEKAVVQGKHGS